MKIATRIHRIGLVNSYLVEEGGEVTIIDAGLPRYWSDLPRELASMGRSLDDVRAVLTHGHSDRHEERPGRRTMRRSGPFDRPMGQGFTASQPV